MKEVVKDFETQLKELVTRFYDAVGVKSVDINIRITPYEESHRINLEFFGCENRDTCKVNCGCSHD